MADQATIRKHELFGSRRQSASSGSHTGKAQGHSSVTCGPEEVPPLQSAELPVLGEGLVWLKIHEEQPRTFLLLGSHGTARELGLKPEASYSASTPSFSGRQLS